MVIENGYGMGGGGVRSVIKILAALLFLISLSFFALAAEDSSSGNDRIEALTDLYKQEKANLETVDLKSREIMATIYDINMRMKNFSRKRYQLNNSMIYAESRVKSLARGIADLEAKIKTQRHGLSQRMRAIYMLGEEGPARIVFSSASSDELDQSLKYLKLISEGDFALITAYEKNKKSMVAKSDQMKKEVKRLLGFKDRVKKQEILLQVNQSSKSTLLNGLKKDREKVMSNITGLRNHFARYQLQSLLNLSFFEHRGRLTLPVRGTLVRDFGLIENPGFQYKLSHKGHLYRLDSESAVRSIYSGRVVYIGKVAGYGRTLILDHGDHYYSVYSNANNILVSEGVDVAAQQTIAKASQSLYFEIRHFSDAIDPKPWMTSAN